VKSEKFLLFLLMAISAVFTFGFTLYVVNPTLHYHYQQIAWYSGKLFLGYYLSFAGGPGEYLALFISQWFAFKALGSLIVTVSGFLISFFLYQVIQHQWKSSKLSLLWAPLIQIVFLALMLDYRYHFSITINLVIVSGLLFLCAAIGKKRWFSVHFHTIFAGAILYYISGGMYFLIFMLASIILLFKKPDVKMLLNISLVAATSVLIPFVVYHFIFLTSLNNSFFRATPDVATMLRYGRPLLFYISLAVIPLVLLTEKILSEFLVNIKVSKNLLNKELESNVENEEIKKLKKTNQKIFIAAQIIIFVATTAYILFYDYQPIEKTKVEIDYYACQENWDKVIKISEKLEKYDRMVNFQYNRALLNTGQVLEKIFDYEQLLGSQGMFLDKPFTSEVALPNSDLYFDLGNIDESQRFAFESETLMRNSPRVLKRLILNCIIMDKTHAANTYINILAANPMERTWVKKYLPYVENPNLAASDSLIMKKRRDMSKTEGLIGTPPLKLLSQLEKNPLNKAAFEYLIALDLMDHDLTSFTYDFKYINPLHYKKLPIVMEEAVILFRSQGKGNEVLDRIRISDETSTKFREFAKLTSASKGDRVKAKQATIAFKNTYWYYVLFLSPKVTNLKLDTQPVDANY